MKNLITLDVKVQIICTNEEADLLIEDLGGQLAEQCFNTNDNVLILEAEITDTEICDPDIDINNLIQSRINNAEVKIT